MRRKEYLRLLRHQDVLDEGHEATVSYLDGGGFFASLSAAEATDQREGGRARAMLVCAARITLAQGDRLVKHDAHYRVLWARSYPHHTEALIEKEDMSA